MIDFGLSAIILEGQTSREGCGTLAFSSPEIVSKDPHTKATDVWSMGIVLYILLTKRIPFVSLNWDETVDNIKNKEINFDQTCWYPIANEAKDLVDRILTKNPANRITIEKILEHPWMR